MRAAATGVAERGYSALTLDAVGAATGVSKGGVLYHFPTKEALVAALLEEPSLLEPLQAHYSHWVARRADDGLPGVDAHVVRLAAGGWRTVGS